MNANLKEIQGPVMKKDPEVVVFDVNKSGLMNVRAVTFLVLWYIFSGCTLFLNKYILSFLNGDLAVLGMPKRLAFQLEVFFPNGKLQNVS